MSKANRKKSLELRKKLKLRRKEGKNKEAGSELSPLKCSGNKKEI